MLCPVRHSLFLRKKLPLLQSSICPQVNNAGSGVTQCELPCGNPIYFDALHIEQLMDVYLGTFTLTLQ